ncbi:serine hydrolase domain-containing protein [Polymorphobacter fuscus]|nr:serine hydrolase domain-containing protein [Polymorphobacter fuscus]NJC09028.1 CubicO group peptidase (beta-lactamase class C family) [Polymorphobacter fuscus]
MMTITETLAKALATAGIPGAVAMVGNRAGVTETCVVGHDGTGTPLAADSMFQLASMTKAVVSVAAMQLVEAGSLALDAPLAPLLPDLADARVITGFGDDGSVATRPAARPITLRHLLTHTSGLGYDFVHADMARARGPGGPPPPGTRASLRSPLLFDPGDGWAYGISTDWVGLAVEAASGQRLDTYVADHVTGPLGMADTMFTLDAAHKARLVTNMARQPDGRLAPFPITISGGAGEFLSGGAGLSGTAGDYMRFLRMLLNGGSLDGAVILRPESVADMARNQIGALRAGVMETTLPAFSARVEWFPDMTAGWGLGFLINPEPGGDGRAAGSLFWAGICNTYYWVDPASDVAAVLMMQLLPFADAGALSVLSAFERAVYSR